MRKLNFEYVQLTFISDKQEIRKQIRNTLILIHLFEKYNNPVRLEKLIEGTQYGYNASALQSGKNKFLRISDIHESKVDWSTVPFCNCNDEETYLLNNEDILIARTGGTTGKSFKIENPPKHSIYAGYLIRIRAKKEVNPDYIYLFLHSFAYWSQIVNLNERNFRPKANAENLKSLILPDCKRSIQDEAVRISQGENIKGYEDLFSEIEKVLSEYDNTQQVENLLSAQLTQLENLNQAILQEAVQGKLVEQNKKNEPASELLKRIKAEKAKSGKKEKPLPPIKPEEIPFEIPDSWVWCRLGEMSINRDGERKPIAQSDRNIRKKIYDYYGASGVIDKIDGYTHEGELLLIGEDGANLVARSTPIAFLAKGKFWVNNHAHVVDTVDRITLDYLCSYINSIDLKPYVTGGFQPKLSQGNLNIIPVPLPPLSEQKRIVSEIEKQLAKTKQLKEHIIANQHATEQLLKALLHQAFAVEDI